LISFFRIDNEVKLRQIIGKGIIVLLPVWLFPYSFSARAEVVVIVSKRSHVAKISAEQAAKIFLGKSSLFPDDGTAIPLDQPEGTAIRDEFYSKVAKKNPSQLSAYWAKVIFTGDGRPPAILENDLAVRREVAANPNAIGYIDKKDVNHTVRVILEP
jgi:ABC-type phosphate transport system substrate-binding protein